ncbi:MAG TPA: ATP-binding protein [Clostridia bacterium]
MEVLNRLRENSLTNQSSVQVHKYKCQTCKDTEFTYDEKTNTIRPCVCKDINYYKHLLEKSGMAKAFQEKSFDNFFTKNRPEIITTAKNIALNYVAKFDGLHSLAFIGQVGAGKTHLCIAVSRELMRKGINVLYMQYRDTITFLKQHMIDEQVYQKEITKHKTVQVLYIDDLYKGRITESDINIMFEIINHRYLNSLPVLISSEFDCERILQFDEAVGSRILEMAKGNIIEFGEGLNYRLV